MSAWSQLPNATHIDRILESLKTHPDIWTRVDHLAAWDAARDLLRDADWRTAWNVARIANRHTAWDAALYAAWDAARPSIVALVAWDDSAQFLDMTGDELEVWAALSEDPQAILLLPAVRVFERIKELESV